MSQIANLVPAAVTLVITVICCVFVIKRNEFYSHNNKLLKKDKTARYHPVILCLYRLVVGVTLGGLFEFRYTGFIVLAMQIGYLLYIIIKRPYKKAVVSVRGIVN
jgi:4-amino-4-deoxy-L-arabinose transferase-like glycosyltransferase